MVRVLQAMAGARHGGAEAFFERLVVGLHEAGLDQRVVIRSDAGRRDRLREAGLDPAGLRFGGRLDLLTPWRLGRLARSYAPDVVMTWMSRASMMMPAGPWVHIARLGGYYDLKYFRGCSHLLGNTRDITRYVRNQGWPADRVHYFPNFVDATPGTPPSRASLDVPEGVPLLAAFGRLHRNKGFDVLIRALGEVPDAHLLLAGVGPLEAELKSLAEDEGVRSRVRFLGWREDVNDLIAAADLLVCSSRHEPLGNVILEGWAQGTPLIATASEGPSDLVTHGETGLLVPVDDASALGGRLREALADTASLDALATAGRAVYERKFSKRKVIKRYIGFFEHLAADSETMF